MTTRRFDRRGDENSDGGNNYPAEDQPTRRLDPGSGSPRNPTGGGAPRVPQPPAQYPASSEPGDTSPLEPLHFDGSEYKLNGSQWELIHHRQGPQLQQPRLQPLAPRQKDRSYLCPECNGPMVEAGIREFTVDRIGSAVVHEPLLITFMVLICLDCGCTKFYAQNPSQLSPRQK